MRGTWRPLPRFEPAARLRPVALVQPGTPLPAAPCAAVETDVPATGTDAEAVLTSGRATLRARLRGGTLALEVDDGTRTTTHRSRRHGRVRDPDAVALTLTGPRLTAFAREAGTWVGRAVLDLDDRPGAPDVHDPDWLHDLEADGDRRGTFGQLGLRDPRLVSHADGTPYREGRWLMLTATSAGPGGFRSGHTSVWALDPATLALEHRGDLFFRRPDRAGVLTDHATHVVRDDDRWLVATSTWGDFDKHRHPRVTTTLAEVERGVDLLAGSHVLATRPWRLPTDGIASVGTWDPHLVRDDLGWRVAFVSARRFFRFHPAVATGPDLRRLRLTGHDPRRSATEGPTWLRRDGRWWLLASDGPESPRPLRRRYPVLDPDDADLPERATLDARYPSNIPWPTVVPAVGDTSAGGEGRWLMVGFDGSPYGGPLLGYGTHGTLVVQSSTPPDTPADAPESAS